VSLTAATKPKSRARDAEATHERPKDQPKPILGVDIKGELRDIEVDLISDPTGVPDRLARVGDAAAIEQLAGSMRECGQLQPVMVEDTQDGSFVRVFGRRRLAAARMLGWKTVRSVVVPPLSPDVRRTVVAIENVQRQDLTPAEETLAVAELMELQAIPAAVQLSRPLNPGCGAWSNKIVLPVHAEDLAAANSTHQHANRHDMLLDHRVRGIASELVAAMLGKPASWVRDRMYIGRLSEKARALVLSEKLPLAHAREISKVADEKLRDQLAKDYAAGGSDSISDTEAGKLEDLQSEVRKQVFALHVVPWNLQVPFAGKPACVGCPNNSATNPGLFEHGGTVSVAMVGGRGTWATAHADSAKVEECGVCTLASCYAEKLRSAKGAIASAAKRIVDADPKKPKKGAVAQAAANVSVKVPDFVDRKALAKKVEDRRESHRPGKTTKLFNGKPEGAKIAEAKRQAEMDWRDAMGDRCEKFEERLMKKLEAKPGAWALLKLLTDTKLYEATQTQVDKSAARAVASPLLRAALQHVANPGPASLAFLESHVGYKESPINSWRDRETGILEVMAHVFEVPLDPAPTIKEFMPKEAAKAAGAVSKQAAPKPAAAKPVNTPRRKPDHVESELEDGGDE